MSGQRKVAMVVAEFLGTYVLATAMLAMILRTNFAFFSAIAAGLVYGIMLLIVGTTSGSHLNPAITIGLWTVRKVGTLQAVVYIIAQLAAGLVAWRLSQYLLGQSLPKLATGGFHWPTVVAEGVGTLVFGFGVAASTQILDVGKKALVAGGSLFAGIAIASLTTYALLNPAVDLAARSWSWGYVVGPVVGAIVGINLYILLFTQEIIGKVRTAKVTTKITTKTTTKRKK
jgi:glycerol uptake facilitator-like aquaporin